LCEEEELEGVLKRKRLFI